MKDRGNVYGHRPDFQDRGHRHHRGGVYAGQPQAVLNQLLIRSGREDQAMMTTLAGLVVVLSILVKQISVLFVTIKSLFAL